MSKITIALYNEVQGSEIVEVFSSKGKDEVFKAINETIKFLNKEFDEAEKYQTFDSKFHVNSKTADTIMWYVQEQYPDVVEQWEFAVADEFFEY